MSIKLIYFKEYLKMENFMAKKLYISTEYTHNRYNLDTAHIHTVSFLN